MKKLFNFYLIFVFLFSTLNLPISGWTQVNNTAQELYLNPLSANSSIEFNPVLIRGVKLDSSNPFHFNFIVDTSNGVLRSEEHTSELQSQR